MTFYLNIKDIVPHNSEFISHNSHLCLRIDSVKKSEFNKFNYEDIARQAQLVRCKL